MAVKITGTLAGSPAKRAKIMAGDTLISINGNPITDVLDYQFYMTDEKLNLLLCDESKAVRTVQVLKREYDDLGLEFQTYLMDRQMGCKNKCLFCFVDQMPKGMRDTLYFKDDDTRMSFLFGNYTTLTNLKESDIQRIIKMHISPINISVHTTNPELRIKMMGNPFAGESLKFIKMLTDGGIKVNSQIVLCPGINDGAELVRSITDLSAMLPNIQSIAVVPVGLTNYRDNLAKLRGFTKKEALDVIKILESCGDKLFEKYSARTVYASDEFYITAGLPFRNNDFYEDFSQLENGVGMMTMLKYEFLQALSLTDSKANVNSKRKVTMATGVLAYPLILEFAEKAMSAFPWLTVQVKEIHNFFFGESITVAGLITGCDLMNQLEGVSLGDELLIPANMLRHEQDKFLDDITIEQVSEKLNIKIITSENDGFELLDKILGYDKPEI